MLFKNIFKLTVAFLIFQTSCHGKNSFYVNKAVLVTGGCGFIGSHVVEKLVELGAQVTILDNLTTGKLENIAAIKDKITLIEGDITDFDTCHKAMEGKKIVFHLAAIASVCQSITDPLSSFRVNIEGTINLLEAARLNNINAFIFSSSAAVYGNQEGVCRETDNTNPLSPYGLSKLIGELCCKEYSARFALPTLCLRYFNVYGDRQDPKSEYAGVVAKFKYQLAHNLPVTIFGEGLQIRDFVKVEKIAQTNLILAQLPHEYLNGQACNVGTGSSINLLELLEMLQKDYPNKTQNIIFAAERKGDIKHSQADCSKLQQLITLIKV